MKPFFGTRALAAQSFLMLGGVIAVGAGSAHADIKYTSETKMGAAGNKPMMTTTTFIMKGAERKETAQNFGPMHMNNVELTLCDKRQHIKLDPALKIYTATAMDGGGAKAGGGDAAGGNGGGNGGQPGTGKIISTVAVKDLGEEMVADVKTEHYMIDTQMQMSGCAGNLNMKMKQEIWVGPSLTTELNCEIPQTPTIPGAPNRPACKLEFETRGDAGAYGKIMSGIIMRMKMYQGGGDQATMVQEVTGLSRAKLDESLFAVPVDYKQVSEQEFAAAQQKAMMESMMKQAQAGAADKGGDGNGDAGNGDANGAGGDKGGNDGNGGANKTPNDGGNNGGANPDNGNKDGGQNGQQEEPKKKKKKLPFKLPF